jgi:hypothetical protein
MQIWIKTLTGRKVIYARNIAFFNSQLLDVIQQAFNFENDQSVLDVKQALQEKEGIQVDQIRLVRANI